MSIINDHYCIVSTFNYLYCLIVLSMLLLFYGFRRISFSTVQVLERNQVLTLLLQFVCENQADEAIFNKVRLS